MAAETESLMLRILCGIVLAQLIFVPGGIWFMVLAIIVGAVYEGKEIDKPSLLPAIISFVAVLAMYAGIAIGFMTLDVKAELLRLSGFVSGHLPAWIAVKDNLLHLPSQLFYNGLSDNAIWLHGTPIIDYVSLIFFLTGFTYMIQNREHYKISRVVIGVFLILSLLLIAINGVVSIALLIPAVYIAVAAGLAYIIDQWLVIFPSNPLARLFGIAVICISVFMVLGYQAERYFIGWPKTEEYHQIYKS
jgi:hypothetical protein